MSQSRELQCETPASPTSIHMVCRVAVTVSLQVVCSLPAALNNTDLGHIGCLLYEGALQRSGAVFLQGTERCTVDSNKMVRLDGNAVFLSAYVFYPYECFSGIDLLKPSLQLNALRLEQIQPQCNDLKKRCLVER
eukprot:COSAG02_NODE_1711_length_11223_cov_5.622348_9_plen_135_part_00